MSLGIPLEQQAQDMSMGVGMPPEAAAICRMTKIRCSANYFEN
jgi:hypothetical protein